MPTIRRRAQDVFSPLLLNSEPVNLSVEQKFWIKEVLHITSSDSNSAEKAYKAILQLLTAPKSVPPVLTTLNPSSIVLGSPSITLHILGSGFDQDSLIIFNGFPEPTTLVSPGEVTTGINMDVWAAPVILPVKVQAGNGLESNELMFEFKSAAVRSIDNPFSQTRQEGR